MSDEDNVDYDIDEDSDEEAIIERQRLKRKQMLYRLQREENYGLSTKKEQEPVKPIMKFATVSAGATNFNYDEDEDEEDDDANKNKDAGDDDKLADTLINEAIMLAEGENMPTPRNQDNSRSSKTGDDYYDNYLKNLQEERLKEEDETRKRLEARRLAVL